MKILVSACLLGKKCRYDGKDNFCDTLLLKPDFIEYVPICPEMMGGLPTPRCPAEIRNQEVFTKDGEIVTAAFQRGARETLEIAQANNCRFAVLKARSPSCGCGMIYDGNFKGTLITGDGITTQLLRSHLIKVYNENEVEELFKEILYEKTII